MTLSTLCQQKGGCIGCCGDGKRTVSSIKLALKKNTLELKHSKSLEEFRDRTGKWDLRRNVCRNACIGETLYCPLHPARNKGNDLRIGHCDVNYLCSTAKKFNKWSEKEQKEFLKYIKNLRIDNVEYSLGMDDGSILKAFQMKKHNS